MRILYVAKHDSGGNDDEGAIAYALGQLGHEVVQVHEFYNQIPLDDWAKLNQEFAFCLFHKWSNVDFIKRLKCPKAFWYFDLVDWPLDATLSSRCEARKRWMEEAIPLVDLGFCTDGDWVQRYNMGHCTYEPRSDRLYHKLHVLRQGADERIVGFGKAAERDLDVLFVGGVKGCGVQRESFVQQLRERYGNRFHWIDKGCYREGLRDLVARSKVVVCPDSPVTDKYWSNRVYVMAGFGACLLHSRVADRIIPGVLTYDDRQEMIGHIDDLLGAAEEHRKKASETVLEQVKQDHLYRHRCEELIRVVKEKLDA